MHGEVRIEESGQRLWVKLPDSDEDRRRLAHEARALRQIRHPGVVQLVDVEAPGDDAELALRYVGGEVPGPLAAAELAGLGAAVATTLADIHDLGAAHGACTIDHVLVEPSGRPVLCSFGRAALRGDDDDLHDAQVRDVVTLTRSLQALLVGEDHRLLRVLARGATRTPTARTLATTLATVVPGARLPIHSTQTRETLPDARQGGPRRRRAGHWPQVLMIAGATVGLGAGTLVLLGRLSPSHNHSAAPSPSLPCPPVDDGCGPLTGGGGRFSTVAGTWTVGEPGDIIVVGRWSCDGTALPALLRLDSGQVWIFDRWAGAGTDVAGRRVATVAGAAFPRGRTWGRWLRSPDRHHRVDGPHRDTRGGRPVRRTTDWGRPPDSQPSSIGWTSGEMVVWWVLLGTALAATLALGQANLSPPMLHPARWERWWTHVGPAAGAFAAVRVVVMGLAGYLAVLGVLAGAVRATSSHRLAAVLRLVSTRALRRLALTSVGVAGLAAAGVAGTSLTGPGAAWASTPLRIPGASAATSSGGPPAGTDPSPVLARIGPADPATAPVSARRSLRSRARSARPPHPPHRRQTRPARAPGSPRRRVGRHRRRPPRWMLRTTARRRSRPTQARPRVTPRRRGRPQSPVTRPLRGTRPTWSGSSPQLRTSPRHWLPLAAVSHPKGVRGPSSPSSPPDPAAVAPEYSRPGPCVLVTVCGRSPTRRCARPRDGRPTRPPWPATGGTWCRPIAPISRIPPIPI